MNLSKALKRAKREARISELFPITHLNTPSIFESQSGFMGCVLKVRGVPFEIEEADTLNHFSFLLHQALAGLDSRFMVYVTTQRHKTTCALKGNFKPGFVSELDARYQSRFQQQTLFTNSVYITLVLKGNTSTKTDSWLTWANKLYGKSHYLLAEQFRTTQMGILTRAIEQLQANLARFGVSRLGENDAQLGYCELLQFLSLVVNAGETLPFPMADKTPAMAQDIPDTFKALATYPQGHIGAYVCRYQLLFGEYVQFQGNTQSEVHFGAMLSLKKYPTDTASILLDSLLSIDCEFMATHTFAPIARDASLKLIQDKRFKLMSAEDKGLSQVHALQDLEDEVATESALLGAHHHSLMLLAPSKVALESAILEATKRYASIGIVAVKETLGLEPAFWSQLPCNQHFIARASLITSKNFVDFCPLHNTQTGFNADNFLGSAVTLLETPSKTPVFFNYHTKGSNTNPSKGHAAIFGGNNAGKTTLVNFFDAQMGRFGGRSFFIDRDASSKIYILACGGRYIEINPASAIAMNPFKLPDTLENRAFLKSWFATLIQEEHESLLPAELTDTINNCIDYAFEQLAPEYRTLSHICPFLPLDFPRWPHLRKWLKKDASHIDGDFHWLFDNEDDALDFDFDKVGFDVTFLIDQVHASIATPVYLYLLHRMRQCLDGRLTSFVIAEAWQVFASPFWKKCLQEWLPTIRKKNGHFIFDTQSPKTMTASPIKDVVFDNLATLIIFPNPMADYDTYVGQLKLTESQFQSVKETSPESRIFLYKQGHDALLCKLDLSHMSEYIRVLSGDVRTVKLVDELINELGATPSNWLPVFLERSAC
ncbi:MAG: VirB4 family type IV secretion/conjugal transfer ATPase [Legionella sp.]|nr:VirB4 family type IV secretion/conjugal transfer ATPase [Legionella sp.]